MAQLVFRCPYTNQPIPSGIESGKASLKVALDYPISLRCPHCGFLHHGTVADGYLTDEPETDLTASP
jgi:hypothetical protein